MLGLGAYESSDDEEVETQTPQPVSKPEAKEPVLKEPQANETSVQTAVKDEPEERPPQPSLPEAPADAEPAGPVLGPSHPPTQDAHMTDEPLPDRISSPFSTSLAVIHDLTLPPVPNLDIPPSPPGSPNPAANAKFAHFLSLKKQGTHFNEKLAGSSSLKNPSLLRKMMNHSGIDEQAQYSTSLPLDLWDMSSLPEWGFKEQLLKTQQEIRQRTEEKRQAGQRDSIEFVSSTSEDPNRSTLPNSRTKSGAGR